MNTKTAVVPELEALLSSATKCPKLWYGATGAPLVSLTMINGQNNDAQAFQINYAKGTTDWDLPRLTRRGHAFSRQSFTIGHNDFPMPLFGDGLMQSLQVNSSKLL